MSDQTIRIEKGIPAPQARSRKTFWEQSTAKMNVGDSFFYPKPSSSISNAVKVVFKARGWELQTRTVDGGCRVWRTK